MGKSKIKTMLLASVMIMLCAAMIVGGTYSLWTGNVTVENHLVAGSLDAQLGRTGLAKYTLNEKGGLSEVEDKNYVDFSGSTPENVFGLGKDEKVVPCSYFEARLNLKNNGTVAFDFTVSIKLNGQTNALAEQLKVTVNGKELGALSEFVEGSKLAVIHSGTLANNSNSEFTVRITFIDDTNVNNNAKEQKLSFDLIVDAIQNTGAK